MQFMIRFCINRRSLRLFRALICVTMIFENKRLTGKSLCDRLEDGLVSMEGI